MGKDIDLFQAVKTEDLMTVQKILVRSSKKPIGSVKQLNINQQDGDGLSVLHHAALAGKYSLMKLLLEHGVKVDVRDSKGLQSLHYAAWLGKEKPVELLLQSGSPVNEPALDGATPLHMASEHGHSDVVEKLLAFKGDPSLPNNQLKTPLDLACEFGRKRVVELLLACDLSSRLKSECRTDVIENNKTTCLHLAARNGHVDVLKLLIEFGFDINRQTPQGTCLHEAAKYGKTEVVRLLLSYGIDVCRLNSYEETALEIVNKYTATRAGKELKQMLKEASSEQLTRAVRDYSKPHDASHLAFKEGDIIMVVDRFLKGGLWRGYCASAGGHVTHVGYFPSDAVVVFDPNTALAKTMFDVPHGSTHPCHGGNGTGHQTASSSSLISSANVQKMELNHDATPLPPLSPARTKSSSDVNRDSGFSANNSCIGHNFTAAESTNGLQNRLSGQSSESGVSGISSYQPSSRSPVSCSQGSLDNLDDSSISSSSYKVHELLQSDLPKSELLCAWLRDLHLEEHAPLFISAGYDLPTVSRMTPEDLTAIGVTQPSVRKKLKSEIARLAIPGGIPDFRPRSVKEWLDILCLDEYNDMLMRQGYTDIDSIMGIMWEDLEEIGILKLGHQKKIMLAVDRLKKITGDFHLQLLNPLNQVTSDDVLTPSGIQRFSGTLSPTSNMLGNPYSETLNPVAAGGTCSSSCDMMKRVNLNSPMESLMLSSPPADTPPFGKGSIHPASGSIHSKSYSMSCQSCSSFRMRNCDNMCKNEVIGPAPPLPYRINSNSSSTLTKGGGGMFSYRNEMENANLSCFPEEWFSSGQTHATNMKTKGQEMPYHLGHSVKDYHLSSYGTIPRGLSQKGSLAGFNQHYRLFKNNFCDWYEAENLPTGSFSNAASPECERHRSKQSVPPNCMNSFKNDARLFGVAGEKLHGDALTPKLKARKRLLDAVNLEGDFRSYCNANYGLPGLNRGENLMLHHRERGFVNAAAANEANAPVCFKHISEKLINSDAIIREDITNSQTLRDNQERYERKMSVTSDSSFISSRNLSLVSLNSSDSSGTLDGNSIPFANEDFGTIKERNSTSAMPSNSETTSDDQTSHDKNGSSKNFAAAQCGIRKPAAESTFQDVGHCTLDGSTLDVDSQRCQNCVSIHTNTEVVFDDIDGMLLGLTQELDEMLKLQA